MLVLLKSLLPKFDVFLTLLLVFFAEARDLNPSKHFASLSDWSPLDSGNESQHPGLLYFCGVIGLGIS